MRKAFSVLLAAILMLVPSVSMAYLRYAKICASMQSLVRDGDYAGFAEKVEGLRVDHPLIMPEEWSGRFLSLARAGLDREPLDLSSEYDLFDDVTYEWFGESREPSREDPCVLVNCGSGFVLSFFLPVDSYIVIREYAAVINGSERVTGEVLDDDFNYDSSGKFERFTIPASAFFVDDLQSLAFRFYGLEKGTVDFFLPDEKVEQLSRLATFSLADPSKELLSLCNDWMWAMNDVVDPGIVPYPVSAYIDEGCQFYPGDLSAETLATIEVDLPRSVLKADGYGDLYSGDQFLVYGSVDAIYDSFRYFGFNGQTVWSLSAVGSNSGDVYVVISDHAKECGWDQPTPSKDDAVVLAVTVCKDGVVFLGIDQETVDAAKEGL